MNTAKDITENLIYRAKNLKEFVVERDYDLIPPGVIRYNIQHTKGHLAKIYVHAMTRDEAEKLVDDWFGESVE